MGMHTQHNVRLNDLRDLISTAITYQSKANNTLKNRRDQQVPPSQPCQGQPSYLGEIISCPPNQTNIQERMLPHERRELFGRAEITPVRRLGVIAFGNAPAETTEQGENFQDFGRGRGVMALLTPAQVMEYPGLATSEPTLLCDRLFGPTILNGFLASGTNVERFVRQSTWMKPENGRRTNTAEAEAVSLANSIHLMILEARSVRSALEKHSSQEVMLRRLWCLLKVEEMVCGEGYTRAQAWEAVQFVLEHRPQSVLKTTALDSYVRRGLSALSRFRTAAQRKEKKPGD